jgi:hypothetical protein
MSLTKATYSMIDGAPVNVLDFGAVGDGVTDSTAAIQAAINSASNSEAMTIVFPPGTYNYDTIYCYYDAVNNPGFNVNRNGELLLTGDGVKPENGGSGGTTLYCTKSTGNGFNVGANDAMPYTTRDFICRDISFGGDTTGFLVSAQGVISAKFENCQFVQENDAGGGLWITTAYFGVLEKCRFMNIGVGTKTGDAIKFGTTNFAGLFTLRDVNVSGYGKGLHFYAGDWQLLSIYDTELAGSQYGVYVSGGRIQTFNMYGCYFEGTCTSFIAVSAANRIQQFQLNGCWGYAPNLSGPCIDLIEPNTVTITNVQIQDLRSAFLNINGVSSGGVPNYMCQGINFTQNGTAPSPITIFTGIVPALFGVEYNTGDANLTLCAAAERPLTYDPSAFSSSYFSAGHMLETKIKDYGAVSGGSLDLQADGFMAMAWFYNVTSPTTIYLPAISAGMPNGFTATLTSAVASTQTAPVKTAIADGAATVGTITPGQQRKFVFFNDGVTTGWK